MQSWREDLNKICGCLNVGTGSPSTDRFGKIGKLFEQRRGRMKGLSMQHSRVYRICVKKLLNLQLYLKNVGLKGIFLSIN